jgi:hypothetical protein
MTAKGSPCPECHYSPNAPKKAEGQEGQDSVTEFARRRQVHTRNFAIFMGLAMGEVAIVITLVVLAFIMRGTRRRVQWGMVDDDQLEIAVSSHQGFWWLAILLLVALGVVSLLLWKCKTLWPVDLNCPSCEIRLDELGDIPNSCPSCQAQLR